MKKLLFLVIGWCIGLSPLFAQGEIQFTLLKASQGDISQSVADALDLRLKQVLTRNTAASASQYNVFAIEPIFEMTDVLTSEGLIQNVSVAKGN